MKLSLESANTSRTIQVHLYDRELRSLPLEINGSFEPGYSYEFLVVSHSFDAKEIRLVTAKDISSITDTLWSQPFQQIEQLEISYMSHIDAKYVDFCLQRQKNLN